MAAWQLLLLFLPLAEVRSDCFSDAIPLAQRQNLTRFDASAGTAIFERPLRMFTPDWAGAKATSAVLEILIQERLGYLLLTNEDTGTTTLDALYALGGCSDASAGLICGETDHYHVSLGWTESYQFHWDFLQREYPSIAPRNLGNIGYLGTRSIFLSSEVREEAYKTEGRSLEFYLSYNSSANNPARYFDQVIASNTSLTSRLKTCNETRLMSSSLMAAYLAITGDDDGVILNGNIVTGRCFDNFFWYAPACRSSIACLMFFTGGDGWGMEDGMHKSAAWNMPLRIAVAQSDQDYAALPAEISSIFYWWVPDSTFLALKPIEIIFPAHDPSASRRGDRRTAAKQISVDKYVSQDLESLAPRVVQLVEAFQMDLAMVTSLLEDQLSSGRTYSSVACSWLRSTATWQSWLPKASECLPRFGVYNPTSGLYLSEVNSSDNGLECRACEAGSYSSRYRHESSSTFICKPCPQGAAQELQGSSSCDLCPAGKYQDWNGSTTCKRCNVGSYQDSKGQTNCKDCPHGTTSLGLASESISDCGCKEGTINVGVKDQDNIRCVTCSEGIDCPFASSLDALISGYSSLGQRHVPTIRRGYQSFADEPLVVFKCVKKWMCPGSVPGQCARGRTKIACAVCRGGQTWLGESCQDCNAWVYGAWMVGICVFLIIIACSYYVMNNKVSAQANLSETISMILLVVLNAAQCLAIIGLVDVSWPSQVEIFFSTFQLFILDLDLYGLRCIMGSETFNNYLFTVLVLPAAQLWLGFCCVSSSWLPKAWQWSWPRVSSTMGSWLLCAFSTTTMVAVTPFMCYLHPNGLHSLRKYPEQLCEDPGAMDTTGLAMLVLYVAGFWVVCAYGVCCLPSWMIHRRREMVLSFRFLIFRLRVDSWWFEVVWMLRGPSLALVIWVLADHTLIQIYTLCLCFAVFLLCQTLTIPWKVPMLNAFDTLLSLFLLSLLVVAPSDVRDDAEEVSAVIMGLLVTVVSVLVLVLGFVIVHRRVLNEQNVFFNMGTVEMPHELRAKLRFFVEQLQLVHDEALESTVGQMSVHDLKLISASVDLLVAEINPHEPRRLPSSRRFSLQDLHRSQMPDTPRTSRQEEEILPSGSAEPGVEEWQAPVCQERSVAEHKEDDDTKSSRSNSITVGKSRNVMSMVL